MKLCIVASGAVAGSLSTALYTSFSCLVPSVTVLSMVKVRSTVVVLVALEDSGSEEFASVVVARVSGVSLVAAVSGVLVVMLPPFSSIPIPGSAASSAAVSI